MWYVWTLEWLGCRNIGLQGHRDITRFPSTPCRGLASSEACHLSSPLSSEVNARFWPWLETFLVRESWQPFKSFLSRTPSCDLQVMSLNVHRGGYGLSSALMSRLISLVGVKWSCLRINEPAFPPCTGGSLGRQHRHCGVDPEKRARLRLA